jgi:hypothetical protein
VWRWAAAAPSTVLVLLAPDLFCRFDGYFVALKTQTFVRFLSVPQLILVVPSVRNAIDAAIFWE